MSSMSHETESPHLEEWLSDWHADALAEFESGSLLGGWKHAGYVAPTRTSCLAAKPFLKTFLTSGRVRF